MAPEISSTVSAAASGQASQARGSKSSDDEELGRKRDLRRLGRHRTGGEFVRETVGKSTAELPILLRKSESEENVPVAGRRGRVLGGNDKDETWNLGGGLNPKSTNICAIRGTTTMERTEENNQEEKKLPPQERKRVHSGRYAVLVGLGPRSGFPGLLAAKGERWCLI